MKLMMKMKMKTMKIIIKKKIKMKKEYGAEAQVNYDQVRYFLSFKILWRFVCGKPYKREKKIRK